MVVVATGIYRGILLSKRTLYQSDFRSEAEAIAMDQLWYIANSNSYETLANLPVDPIAPYAVPQTSPLFPRGGTVRVSALVYSDHVQVIVRVDYMDLRGNERAVAASETLSMDRYPIYR